jgi:enterochelin esterase-like enzyme
VNRRFHQFLAQEKIEHIYDEGPGAHTWDYWNEKLRYALEQDNRA